MEIVTVNSLSELGASNSTELLRVIAKYQENGIMVESVQERSIFDVLSFAAALDATYRSNRQRAVTTKAWSSGKLAGRKSTMDKQMFAELYAEHKAGNITLVEFARRMDRQRQTIRKAITRYEETGTI